jgi:hypothetical protein
MADSVFDTTVIAAANAVLADRVPGNRLDRCVAAIEDVAHGLRRLRYNRKLYEEYRPHLRERRNDIVEVFVALLDSPNAVVVPRSTLPRPIYARALQCGWPSHDQHLLAAAIDGEDPILFVTERRHWVCCAAVWKRFAITVTVL